MKAQETIKAINKPGKVYVAVRLTKNDNHLIQIVKSDLIALIYEIDRETPGIEFECVEDMRDCLIVGF